MNLNKFGVKPKMIPILDKEYRPVALINRAFSDSISKSGKGLPVKIALEREDGLVSTFETAVFCECLGMVEENLFYIERLIKSLLWIKGGWRVIIGGPLYIGEYIKKAYSPGGLREFDARTMSRIYEREFSVEITDFDKVPQANERTHPVGRHLDGCRIGFDAGGSDRKVAAVIDGNVIYSEEVVWHPKLHSNPDYHYREIMNAIRAAASHMPRVDTIGISSAGVYINNRVMSASLFMKVPDDIFKRKVKNMFLDIQREMGGIPLEVCNDGDVAALAGAMELKASRVLGIAMGTSEAAGYVDSLGNIYGWLNELAFVPVDFNQAAPVDEWSGDFGCGVKYFSQDSVIRLARVAGIELAEGLMPAEKLKVIQELHVNSDRRSEQIFETIGCYLGYTIAYYADFYDLRHVLVLGRVSSGEGGNVIVDTAREVIKLEFPELAGRIKLHLPDESGRRLGQAIAAASLPEIR